jgi:hypothetical protein
MSRTHFSGLRGSIANDYPVSPVKGDLVFDATLANLVVFDGTDWRGVAGTTSTSTSTSTTSTSTSTS